MKRITVILLTIAILLSSISSLGVLTSAEVVYGTKGNPLVNNADATPIVVNSDEATFPDGMQIKENAKFTGSEGDGLSTNGVTAGYSDTIGTYYGDTAGSLSATVNSFPSTFAQKSCANMQFRKDLVQIEPSNANNASFAFWVNAPAEMYVRVTLFSYGYGGDDSSERNFYSSELRVQPGANLVEIPLADFTVDSNGAVDLTKNIKIFASRFYFRNVENGEDITGKTVYIDNVGVYFQKNALSDYVTPYGTKGYPLVENDNTTPIVVNSDTATFPEGMQIKDPSKFTGSVNTGNVSSSTVTAAYSDATGTYYGNTAGSLGGTINSFGSKLNDKYYATLQFKDNMYQITPDEAATSSYAFWVYAPSEMYLTVILFSYGYGGSDNAERSFYSSELKVKAGANLIEIPLANFTVNSNGAVDLTKNIKIFANRFCFRNVEDGEDLRGKTVYIDNMGIYTDMNALTDYVTPYGTKGYPLVENENSTPIVAHSSSATFPDGMQIKDPAKFTGSISSVSDSSTVTSAYSDAAGTYYGNTAGSLAATVNSYATTVDGKTYATVQLRNDFYQITLADANNSSFAFWINAPTEMYLRVWLFSYGTAPNHPDYYSREIKVESGTSLIEIPLADFTVRTDTPVDLTKNIKLYVSRFCFRSVEDGEDLRGKTVYIDNIGVYTSMNSLSDYIKEYGTLGNPVVANPNNQPIVVNGTNKDFPDSMQIKDFAKFTGKADYISALKDTNQVETSTVGYSSDKGTYYGSTAGSVSVKVNSLSFKTQNVLYGAMQILNPNSAFGTIPAANLANASVAFWVNAPEKMSMRLSLYAYRHSGTSGDISFYSQEIEVEKGANFVEIPLANFTVSSNNSIDSTRNLSIYAVRFLFNNIEDGEDITGKTVYVDNIGFYNDMNTADDYTVVVKPEVEEPKVDGTATHNENAYIANNFSGITNQTIETLAPVHTSSKGVIQTSPSEPVAPSDFFEGYKPVWDFEGENLGWERHSSWSFDVSSSTKQAYSGTSLKLTFNKGDTDITSPRVICSNYTVNVAGYDGIILWVYSEKDITFTCLGIMNNCGKTNQISVSVKAGGQIVQLPFDEFANFAAFKGATKTITQFQFSVSNAEDGSTIYIDDVGYYKNSEMAPVNENAYGSIGKSLKISTLEEQKTVAGQINRVDVDFKSDLTDLQGNKWEEEAVLAVWIKTNRAVNIRMGAGASTKWDPATGKNHWFSQTHTVPAGESILRIPLSEFVTKVNWTYTSDAPDWSQYIGRLIFQISTLNNVELEMYIDQIALEYPVIETPIIPAYHDKNSYVWWNFDNNQTVEDLDGDWEAHWAGENGEGSKIAINTDPKNSYNGKGNSLQVDYDSSFADWGLPTVWHEKEMTVYGDGITFWLKTAEKMQVSLVMIAISPENKWITVSKTGIPVDVGENIVTVKYDELKTTDSNIPMPEFSRVVQFQIRLKGTYGTAYLDSIGFSGVVDDGSNEFKFLNPPASYDNYEKGVSIVGEDFENSKEDDLDFCTNWYYEDTGWITLEKINGNTMLRMDYDMTKKASVLKSVKYYNNVDPNGGISFYLKSTENRKFGLALTLGSDIVRVVIDGTTEGRYYYIPLSAFWNNKNIKVNYEPTSSDLITVKKLELYTDSTYNPPSVGASKKCSIWLDDVKFVDSLSYKRSADIDHSENGVRLIASAEAFASGVTPKFTIVSLSEKKKADYISKMRNVDTIHKEISLKATSNLGVDLIPQRQVELIFDVPTGVDAKLVTVWQAYFDGSVMKVNAKVGDDNKIHVLTYKLGNFIIASGVVKDADFDDEDVLDNNDVTDDTTNDNTTNETNNDKNNANNKKPSTSVQNKESLPIVWIVVGAALVLIAIGAALFICLKIRRTKNDK